MTYNLIDRIKADRKAGTPGPFENPYEDEAPINGGLWVENIFFPMMDNETDKNMTAADARRTARVPEMEARILADAEALKAADEFKADVIELLAYRAACDYGKANLSRISQAMSKVEKSLSRLNEKRGERE